MDYAYDLGTYSLPVTTHSAKAQIWFNRGLNWCYGFNHEEAVVCFQRAAQADPTCAMAHWGIAYAAGPNYNMPWDLFDEKTRAEALQTAHAATQSALEAAAGASAVERALVAALAARYPQADLTEDMEQWNHDFAEAMRLVHLTYPDHLDACAIFAESLMNLTPWKMWDLATGLPAPGAATPEAQRTLEKALATLPGAMTHPGLLHMYVHLMEMSPTPEKALKAADVLRTLVPDAGHLVHMPTHIDVLCGHYQNVVHWNQQGIAADLKYYEANGAYNIYTGYRQHNYHFVIYGALFLGQMQPALDAVRGMADTTPPEMLKIKSPPMADYFETILAMEPHVLIRFGRWHDILDLVLPDDAELFCTMVATIHYAKGVALAALGRVDEALQQEQLFQAAKARVPDTRLLHNNKAVDLLEIAVEMLRGEITYRQADYDTAYAHLRRAVHLEDTLPYDEPWGWMQPSRHALGALLLEQGYAEQAETTYREDLGLGGQLSRATVHPDNVWALKGLHDCLVARGDTVELPHIKQRLDLALARADRAVAASCFCAQAAMAG